MTSIVDDCAHHCLLPDDQSTLYDALPPFDEELAQDVTDEELSLPPPAEAVDDNQVASGSSLPATPAERPCTFCPSSLPLPTATCPTRATLVLDLDGTLIASEELNAGNSAYLWNTPAGARAPDYEAMGRRVWLRPGVREFLAAVRPHFEIILFTAATQNWAAAAIEQLDPSAELFDVMLHRDHTTSDLMWDYVKDLSRLGRDLARVVIVDDNPLMFMYQPDNALHIGAYEAATAGGPDNVLPRVADVLINQVAPASDVRDVLGPMASAKSCITSTVSAAMAAQVAAHPSAQPGDVTSEGALSQELSSPSAVEEQVMADSYNANGCSAADVQSDAIMADEKWGIAVGEAQQNASTQLEKQLGEGLEAQACHVESAQCSGGLGQDCELHCSLSNDAGKDGDWDGESEGPETFDEHGAAAQLGSDVVGSCHRHHAWDEMQRQSCNDGSNTAAVAVVPAAAGSGEHEESDACPSEEPSIHSSEDFEALMDDAMAEYDSDAYEGSYDDGTGFDCPCPADTEAPATKVSLAGQRAGCGGFGSDNSCCEMDYAGKRSIQLCARDNGNVEGDFTPRASITVVEAQPSVPHTHAVIAEPGFDSGGLSEPAAAEGINSPAGGTLAAPAGTIGFPLSSQSGQEATEAPAAHMLCHSLEDTQGQSRQLQLPTGMVFLTDLNPAFGTAGAALEANRADVAASDSSDALLAADDAIRELPGSKRPRSDAELACGCADAGRDVVARLSCDGTPHSSRMRLTGVVVEAPGESEANSFASPAATIPCTSS